ERDALWKLDLEDGGRVVVARDQWHKRGDANRWLTSDVFDLAEPMSLAAEEVLRKAQRLIDQADPAPEEVRHVDAELGRVLPEMDPYFVRWRYHMGKWLEATA
ncbi:MAG: hypothetical protein KC431_31840, partial [Myxococcales bacterium]|nr:hypothetical protein [Myxococcales bacterium]